MPQMGVRQGEPLRHTMASISAGGQATSVLLADDDARLRQFLELELQEEGYAVRSCSDGIGALTAIRQHTPDLLVLDWMLPDLSGVEVCQRLRSTGVGVPVLMLTGRDAVKDRVEALDAGADDYLVKPFAIGELSARVRALLRRDTTVSSAVVERNGIELDAGRHEVRVHGVTTDLTAKEFALLRWFLLHPHDVHSAEKLLEHVWDEHADPFTNTVRVTLSNLRKKLADAGAPDAIETLPGRGYRWRELQLA